jgi:hypothetical protein
VEEITPAPMNPTINKPLQKLHRRNPGFAINRRPRAAF